MRNPALLTLAATLLLGSACVPSDDGTPPDWLKQPKAYQPKTADLTFNDEGLGKFNIMTNEEREAFLKDLKGKKGSFKGQAISKTGASLGEGMPDAKYGEYELNAITEAIHLEITIDYHIFTTTAIGDAIAPNRAVEFTGTLLELDFYEDSKPRKVVMKVAADTLAPMKD
jgi:hypothetical protein